MLADEVTRVHRSRKMVHASAGPETAKHVEEKLYPVLLGLSRLAGATVYGPILCKELAMQHMLHEDVAQLAQASTVVCRREGGAAGGSTSSCVGHTN